MTTPIDTLAARWPRAELPESESMRQRTWKERCYRPALRDSLRTASRPVIDRPTFGITPAGLINFYDPYMVVIGGGVSQSGGQYLAAIRETIEKRSLPLATRDLQVVLHPLGAEVRAPL